MRWHSHSAADSFIRVCSRSDCVQYIWSRMPRLLVFVTHRFASRVNISAAFQVFEQPHAVDFQTFYNCQIYIAMKRHKFCKVFIAIVTHAVDYVSCDAYFEYTDFVAACRLYELLDLLLE